LRQRGNGIGTIGYLINSLFTLLLEILGFCSLSIEFISLFMLLTYHGYANANFGEKRSQIRAAYMQNLLISTALAFMMVYK
jgi:uncharacterized membrane protein YjgN (DUF898 family)